MSHQPRKKLWINIKKFIVARNSRFPFHFFVLFEDYNKKITMV